MAVPATILSITIPVIKFDTRANVGGHPGPRILPFETSSVIFDSCWWAVQLKYLAAVQAANNQEKKDKQNLRTENQRALEVQGIKYNECVGSDPIGYWGVDYNGQRGVGCCLDADGYVIPRNETGCQKQKDADTTKANESYYEKITAAEEKARAAKTIADANRALGLDECRPSGTPQTLPNWPNDTNYDSNYELHQ